MIDAVDLFAGPGGWDVAADLLGIDVLGFENDPATCRTRDAAGHRTVPGDLAKLNPRDYLTRGQIASPPCQGFSLAGKGRGRRDSILLLDRLDAVRTRADLVEAIADLHEHMTDDRSLLVLEPLRWALTNTPSWLAWEQVVGVLPIWEACARILRRIGYSVATGIVNAEQHGVPQTRRRAILLARAPWLVELLGPVSLPAPTHSRYHVRTPERLDVGVVPWVSMAAALGWAEGFRIVSNYGSSGDASNRGTRAGDQPSATVTSKVDRNRVQLATGTRPSATSRAEDEPAPTLAFGKDAASHVWTPDGMTPAEVVEWKASHHGDAVNNQSGTPYDVDAQVSTPATALAGRDLVGFRGPNANRFNGSSKSRNDGIRLTPAEASVLQTFPADYPWQGTRTEVYSQIGNAVPPRLALVLLAEVTGLALPGDDAAAELPRPSLIDPVFAGGGIASERTAGAQPRDPDTPAATITGKGTASWKERGAEGTRRLPAAR